ncbi:hypothetical protein SRHO_G00049730 [Serrasalmus rhombeus]
MATIRLALLLQVGFVIGSSYGYMQWSPRDRGVVSKQPLRKPPDRWGVRWNRDVDEQQRPSVVTEFLQTGDSSALRHANCSGRYELNGQRGRSRTSPHRVVHGALDAVTHASAFLSALLRANSTREQSLRRDVEWYRALVRSILEGDARIHRAVLAFSTGSSFSSASGSHAPHIFLQATRAGGEIVLQDLSATPARHGLQNETANTAWYHDHRGRKRTRSHERGTNRDSASHDDKRGNGENYVVDKTHVRWSAPYLECEDGSFIPRWLLTLSAGFYGLKPNLTPDFRGVVRVDVSLQDVDIDQCSTDGWFAGTHRCNLTSMECLPIPGHGFVLGKYKCQCKSGFYHPNRVAINGFKRKAGNLQDPEGLPYDADAPSHCLPCQEGCAFCKDDTPCVAHGDSYLSITVLSFQGICMLLDFISMVLVYHFRRNKSIRASGLVLLEAILFGALLLYFPFSCEHLTARSAEGAEGIALEITLQMCGDTCVPDHLPRHVVSLRHTLQCALTSVLSAYDQVTQDVLLAGKHFSASLPLRLLPSSSSSSSAHPPPPPAQQQSSAQQEANEKQYGPALMRLDRPRMRRGLLFFIPSKSLLLPSLCFVWIRGALPPCGSAVCVTF